MLCQIYTIFHSLRSKVIKEYTGYCYVPNLMMPIESDFIYGSGRTYFRHYESEIIHVIGAVEREVGCKSLRSLLYQ